MVHFAYPVFLPVFRDDQRLPDQPASGYQQLQQTYDGFKNKVEILPCKAVPGLLGSQIPNGQPYTIGIADLYRRVHAANHCAQIVCSSCNLRKDQAGSSGCCAQES